jgi:Sporulation and spore germination
MIPRYQRILFWILVGSSLLMTLFLLHGCEQAHKKLTALADTNPLTAPTASGTEDFTFYLANDADGSITPAQRSLALPQDPTVRARTLLQSLFAEYSLPASAHVLQSGPAVDDVFFLNLPIVTPIDPAQEFSSSGQLAVINLHKAFVDNHPSGIEVEDLTVQSIIGTLHAAFPRVTQIRFLVEGQPHDTLAGHADLLRTYPADDTTFKPTPPSADQEAPK